MRIRYGFNIEIDVTQPTTILTAMDVEVVLVTPLLLKRMVMFVATLWERFV